MNGRLIRPRFELKNELNELSDDIKEAFYRDLEFGTGPLALWALGRTESIFIPLKSYIRIC